MTFFGCGDGLQACRLVRVLMVREELFRDEASAAIALMFWVFGPLAADEVIALLTARGGLFTMRHPF